MAKFEGKGLVSVRAHHLVKGETYTMGFSKNTSTHRLVKFNGFQDAKGNPVDAPKILKAMDPTHTMAFTGYKNGITPEELTVVKDPDGYGAVFIQDGDKLRRVTFGADPALIATLKAEKAAASPEAEEAPVEEAIAA